jgi:hypothetical protein
MANGRLFFQSDGQAADPLPIEFPDTSAQLKSQSQTRSTFASEGPALRNQFTGDSIMEDKNKLTVTESVAGAESDPYTPRKLTLAENAILTVKVLGMLGVIGAAIWGFNFWTSAQ